MICACSSATDIDPGWQSVGLRAQRGRQALWGQRKHLVDIIAQRFIKRHARGPCLPRIDTCMAESGPHPTLNAKVLRRKATFLLHAFESALYAYACNKTVSLSDLPAGVVSAIRARVKGRSGEMQGGVAEYLEYAYLDEIFDSAIAANCGLDSEVLLRTLKGKCQDAGLFEIRNACAHPARDFPVFYWYRAASVAADPIIFALGLQEVYEALLSAEGDRISDPPSEWLEKFIAQVPNNLPAQSEHELTGLIGREKELQQLIERLASPGVSRIAITGYGGIGKTSIALQALQRIRYDPSIAPALQGIIYLTLKTEKLTSDGIVSLENSAALIEVGDALQEAIRESGLAPDGEESFEIGELSSKRLIICIDNAESLIKSDENSFVSFLDALPLSWKIILTSRLTVDGARTLPVEPLKNSQSELLARRYISARNLSADSDLARQVGQAAKGNPLCVRLIIDKICLGVDVTQAISIVGQDLVRFSFTSLLEVLPESAHKILEALYLAGSASRAELSQLLELEDDTVVESIRLLQKTSLISTSFTNGYESLSLSDAVSDLLMNQPLLSHAREEVREKLRLRSQRLQTQQDKQERDGGNVWDLGFIPADSPIGLKTLLIDADLAARRGADRERLIAIAAALNNAQDSFSKDPYYWRARARMLDKLGDPSAESMYRRAMDLASEPASFAVLLAQCIGRQGRARQVIELLEPIIERGIHLNDEVGIRYRRGLVYNYVRAMRDLDRFQEVVDFCQKVTESDLWMAFSPFWISSVRQASQASRRDCYLECMDIAQRCIYKGMHSAALVDEMTKVLGSMSLDMQQSRMDANDLALIIKPLMAIGPALASVRGERTDPQRFLDAYRRFTPEQSPVLSKDEEDLVALGYIRVTLENIPVDGMRFPSYLFFKSDAGEAIFCHRSSLSDTDLSVWNDLHVGDRAFVLPIDADEQHLGKLRKSASTVIFGERN